MLGYALPIPDGKLALWFPAPRIAWGEMENIDGLTILSPINDLDTDSIPLQVHDNIFRFDARAQHVHSVNRGVRRMMLWGIIWLVGMNRPAEDILGGLYLLIGQPVFAGLYIAAIRAAQELSFRRFKNLFYAPDVEVVYSHRLAELYQHIWTHGITSALEVLDELGLGHLREFYKRAAWQTRWKIGAPTGAGLLRSKDDA